MVGLAIISVAFSKYPSRIELGDSVVENEGKEELKVEPDKSKGKSSPTENGSCSLVLIVVRDGFRDRPIDPKSFVVHPFVEEVEEFSEGEESVEPDAVILAPELVEAEE